MPRAAAEAFAGIDFGTTTSLVAWGRLVEDGRGIVPETIPVPQDSTDSSAEATPTLVYFPAARRIVVGEAAREQLGLRPDRVVRRLKQMLGRVERVEVAGHGYDPVDLAAAILRRLKKAAEARLGFRVRRAVITVPASFDVRRRRAILDAAARAGFEVTPYTLLDEPLAALVAAFHEQASRRPEQRALDLGAPRTVLVIDVGGGTSDSCVARITPSAGGPASVETLGLSRYTQVGGDDFDALVAGTLLDRFCERSGLDLEALPPSDRLLLEHRTVLAAERAKRELAVDADFDDGAPAAGPVAEIRQMFLHGTHHMIERLDREAYARMVAPLLSDPRSRPPGAPQSVLDAPLDALAKAGVEPSQVDLVLLAGGMANVPAVRDAVRACLGVEPVACGSPTTAVVAGAVVQHFARVRGLPHLRPSVPTASESVGVRTAGGGFRRLIGAGTPLPARVEEAGAFAVPPGGGRYVRIPICEGDAARPDGNRIVATLALRFAGRVPPGEPIVVEASMDGNKVLSLRGYLRRNPGLAAVAVMEAGAGDLPER